MSTSLRDGVSDAGGAMERTETLDASGADAQRELSQESKCAAAGVAGERGIPSVNRVRSMQSRVSSALAIGLMAVIGIGFLVWYYSHALGRGERVQASAERATRERAQSEMVVPPLGPIQPPRVVPIETPADDESGSWMDKALGEPPPLSAGGRGRDTHGCATGVGDEAAGTQSGPAPQTQIDGRLTGAVFIGVSRATRDGGAPAAPMSRADLGADPDLAAAAGESTLESTLTPSVL